MTPAGCPACGGSLAPWRDVIPAEPPGAPPVGLLRCPDCGTAVTDAPPPPAAHDTGAYATHRPRLRRTAGPVLDRFDRRRLRLLGAPALGDPLLGPPGPPPLGAPGPHPLGPPGPPPLGAPGPRPPGAPGPRLLDVGAGRGRFVAAARNAGFQADGIEPSARGVRAAREQYAVELRAEEIATATVAPDRLDAVTVWHVLEHLDDPAAALATVVAWLRPGGLILIGVPNLASLQARIGGARWFHLDVPRHRTHFTTRGLELLLTGCGLDLLHTTHVLAEHNPFGMWQSIVNRWTRRPSYLYNLLKRNAPLAPGDLAITLATLPLVPLAAGLELAAGLAGHGGTIAVLARRPPSPA